jgi:RNA polymerase primary sigma factor
MNAYVNDFNTTVQTYYTSLKKFNPISREREEKLFNLIKYNGDFKARQEIIESHLKFVFNVAKKYKGMGIPMEDLISEGNIGLTKAIDKFDNEKGVKFISYAVWWIRQSIQECLNKRSKITSSEVSEEENVRVVIPEDGDINDEIIEYCFETTSEYDDVMNDLNASKEYIVVQMLKKLPPRGQKIISYYYGLNGNKEKNLEEIGLELNITKERVRQIKEQCLKILRTEILMLDNYEDLFL